MKNGKWGEERCDELRIEKMENVGLAALPSFDFSPLILISSRSSLRSLRLCVHELSRFSNDKSVAFSGDPKGSA